MILIEGRPKVYRTRKRCLELLEGLQDDGSGEVFEDNDRWIYVLTEGVQGMFCIDIFDDEDEFIGYW